MTATRYLSIDLLKAYAIISVILLHALSVNNLLDSWYLFHIGQAVPIFLVLLGYNMANSFKQKGNMQLKSYYRGRFIRLVPAFLAVWLAAVMIGSIPESGLILSFKWYDFLGRLPVLGPGNYYIGVVFEFAIIFPLFYRIYRLSPRLAVISGFLIQFLVIMTSQIVFGAEPILYFMFVLRYMYPIMLGVYIADDPHPLARRNLILLFGFLAGLAYVFALSLMRYLPSDVGVYYPLDVYALADLISYNYGILIVQLALTFLPSGSHSIWRAIGRIGQASYHIFLFQIVYFALNTNFSFILSRDILNLSGNTFFLVRAFESLVVCITGGLLFHAADQGLRKVLGRIGGQSKTPELDLKRNPGMMRYPRSSAENRIAEQFSSPSHISIEVDFSDRSSGGS